MDQTVQDMSMPATYSVAEVAAILQVSQSTVRQLTHHGVITRLPIKRPWRYSREEITRFLANGATTTGPSTGPSPGGVQRPTAGLAQRP